MTAHATCTCCDACDHGSPEITEGDPPQTRKLDGQFLVCSNCDDPVTSSNLEVSQKLREQRGGKRKRLDAVRAD